MKKLLITILISVPFLGTAQQTFTETFGTVSANTPISNHESANNFDLDPLTYSGTADLRNTSASSGYTGASGGANVFFSATGSTSLTLTGLSPAASCSSISLTFGISKSTTADNGANFQIQYSTDGGGSWTSASAITLPTGTGTTGWYQRSVSGIPGNANAFRFVNLNGTGGTSYRLDDLQMTGNGAGCTLPVRLLSFKSEAQPAGIELTWQTGEEIGNSHFDIEKSSNAQNFEVIGRVNGKGNSNILQAYSYLDAFPGVGQNYYRLKQVDFDGKMEYSRVIAAKFNGTGVFRAYPNPVSTLLTLDLPSGAEIESGQLFDLIGRSIIQFSTNHLPLESIQNGVYLLKVKTKDGRSFDQRIVKMN